MGFFSKIFDRLLGKKTAETNSSTSANASGVTVVSPIANSAFSTDITPNPVSAGSYSYKGFVSWTGDNLATVLPPIHPEFAWDRLPFCQTEIDFLKTLVLTPEDVTTPLIYADWLEENHQPHHSEYLRLIQQTNLTEKSVMTRVAEMYPYLDKRWLPLVEFYGNDNWTLRLGGWKHRRGHAHRKARRFFTHAAKLTNSRANSLIHSESGIIRSNLGYADACRLWLGISLWAHAGLQR